jgi:ammonium transporter, Amt family
MRTKTLLLRAIFALTGCLTIVSAALGQTVEERLATAEANVKVAQTAGDNAWMLASSALVLLMTGPGLALFYGGLVRKKNVLATMMQSFILMAVITVIWAIFGYSLSFAKGSPFIGGLSYLLLKDVGAAPSVYAGTIPHQTYMVFQLMFAIITPALITGAFAERMKFSAMLLFCSLWAVVVYFPMAHMVWGDGGFLNAFFGGSVPALDFAGGTVVHMSSGFSALVCALYLGKRLGYPKTQMAPHNLVISVIGACLLWVGWFGFNAGSAVNASGLASSAFVATHFGAASAVIGWLVIEWIRQGKPTVLGGVSGAVAGLVAITPASGFVTPMAALIIGFVAGMVCYFAVTSLKKALGYDDSLDAFGVHGVGGFTGAVLTGVFANSAINTVFKDANGAPLPSGLIEGNSKQVINQLIASLIAISLAVVGSFVILKIVDLIVGVRATGEDEVTGLDLSQHGEEGYNLDLDVVSSSQPGVGYAEASFAAAANPVRE